MKKKFTDEVAQNLKICGKIRKYNDFRKKNHTSKKPRQKLTPKTEHNVHEVKIFKCDICSKSFKTKSNLNLHFSSLHEEKMYNCDICSSNFTVKGSLKTHIESVHEGKTFKCELCFSSFA